MTAPPTARDLNARERWLATLSHEIRTPLNGVLGMADLLAATPLDATQRAYLQTLRDCGDHLLGLVNGVLDWAKLEQGDLRLEPAKTDLEGLLQGVAELLSPRANAGGIELAWAVDPDLPLVLADDGRLRQILFNLAGNAVKLTASGGVLLTAERRFEGAGRLGLRLAVRDTGPGLDPACAVRLFEEFEQAEAGVAAGGAGLGLAIVKRLAEAMGGSVAVQSRPGEGALFAADLDLPIVEASLGAQPLAGLRVGLQGLPPVTALAAARQIAASGGVPVIGDPRADVRLLTADAPFDRPGPPALVLLTPETRQRWDMLKTQGYAGFLIQPLRRASLTDRVLAVLGRAAPAAVSPSAALDERQEAPASLAARVLLAEDNPVNALLAQALLAREGCVVERVVNGREALEAAARTRFDLILLDGRMPEMDGPETARRLRASGWRGPVLALTANAFEEDRRACLEAGMDDFLVKPLEPRVLRAALARWLPAAAGAARSVAA